MNRKIILASRSPRRKRMLEQMGLVFEIRGSEYDEDMDSFPDFKELAQFLAFKKAEDVARHYEDAIIIGGDTFTIFEGKFIGKPKDSNQAKEILKNFSGKEHDIISGFAIIDTKNSKVIKGYGEAKVKFRNLSDEEIENYVETGEPMEMAGGYGLLDKGAVLVESIGGDFYSVIGLPLAKVFIELKKLGVKV